MALFGGWWKERYSLKRYDSVARFSLVITIDAGENNVDVYTPIANMVATTI